VDRRALAALAASVGALGVVLLVSRRAKASETAGGVALVGDSYAVGLGPQLEKLLPGLRYEGHVGSNTAQWASGAYGATLADFRPGTILVSLGVNDGQNPNVENYRALVQRYQSGGARVIWIEPPLGINVPAVRNAIKSLGVKTVPARLMPMAADGIHPASYSGWAGEIATVVDRE